MITLSQYLGKFDNSPDLTDEYKLNALNLLRAVEKLQNLAEASGTEFKVNPVTNSQVSGSQYGGFRPKDCPEGAMHSSHKEGLAVDIYDPQNRIDAWCMMHSGKGGLLEQCGIYIEHPDATNHWSHWTIKAPGSGNRVFRP